MNVQLYAITNLPIGQDASTLNFRKSCSVNPCLMFPCLCGRTDFSQEIYKSSLFTSHTPQIFSIQVIMLLTRQIAPSEFILSFVLLSFKSSSSKWKSNPNIKHIPKQPRHGTFSKPPLRRHLGLTLCPDC